MIRCRSISERNPSALNVLRSTTSDARTWKWSTENPEAWHMGLDIRNRSKGSTSCSSAFTSIAVWIAPWVIIAPLGNPVVPLV